MHKNAKDIERINQKIIDINTVIHHEWRTGRRPRITFSKTLLPELVARNRMTVPDLNIKRILAPLNAGLWRGVLGAAVSVEVDGLNYLVFRVESSISVLDTKAYDLGNPSNLTNWNMQPMVLRWKEQRRSSYAHKYQILTIGKRRNKKNMWVSHRNCSPHARTAIVLIVSFSGPKVLRAKSMRMD